MLSIGMERARLGKAAFRATGAVRPRKGLNSGAVSSSALTRLKTGTTSTTRTRSSLGAKSGYGGTKLATAAVTRPTPRRLLSGVPKGPQQLEQQVETVFERQVREAKSDLKMFMTQERRPLRFAGLNTTTTIGMMCGHASFGIAALVYLETDVMTVRWLVLGGSSLGLLFSYYRHPPLLISIKWLTLTLILNTALLAVLSNERGEAEELAKDPEKARIFQELFMAFDLTPLDFLRLMDLAQRRVWLKGNDINQEGRPYEAMFLIVEGGAEVKSQGETVSHLKPGGFIGSLAFNRFIQEPVVMDQPTTTAAADIDIDQPEFVYVESTILEGGSSIYGDGDGRSTRQIVKGAFLHLMRQDHIIGKVAKSLVSDVMGMRVDADEMERCKTTVTATSDVVTYGWDMHALRAFIKRRPLIGASLQKAMAEDFINKVYQARGHEERYRLLLVESLDPGSINPIGMEKLRRYREMHHISEEVHNGFLVEQGWTEDEFRAGFRNTEAPRDGSKRFLEYEALVARELGKGQVKPEVRSILRSFRSQAGIDAQEHLLAIQKQGWSADDYEVGGKGKGEAAVLDQISDKADKFN